MLSRSILAMEIQRHTLPCRKSLRDLSTSIDCHSLLPQSKEFDGNIADIIKINANEICIFIGSISDVSLLTALTMVKSVSLIHAYSEMHNSPSKILESVCSKLNGKTDKESVAIALFIGILNIRKMSLTYCNAGHHGVFVQSIEGEINVINENSSQISLGGVSDTPREDEKIILNMHDRIVLCSYDHSCNQQFAQNIYNTASIYQPNLTSEQYLKSLLDDLDSSSTFINHRDSALLISLKLIKAVASHKSSIKLQVLANLDGLKTLKSKVNIFCEDNFIQDELAGKLLLLLDELVSNTIYHGRNNGSLETLVELDLIVLNKSIIAQLRDNCIAFNPLLDVASEGESELQSGLGLLLVRSLTDSFSYAYEDQWNVIRLAIDNIHGIDN